MFVTVRQSSSFHILTSFAQVDADIRKDIISLLLLGNDVASAEALVADKAALKSCSIDEMFVSQRLKALHLQTSSLQLCTKISLSQKCQRSGQSKP